MSALGVWLEQRRDTNVCFADQIPFAELEGWDFTQQGGDLAHRSGGFFTIGGLRVTTADRYWTQPIIHQPEIGILGLLVRRQMGRTSFLMQAKAEPGNANGVQLSPTVQATRSNFSRVHKGARTRYLEYFAGTARGRVLVDVLQSEQGSWFYRKRNRNMVVETAQDLPEHPDFRWCTLDEVHAALAVDNAVNMDARSVLSCLRLDDPERDGAGGLMDIQTWLNDTKMTRDVHARPVGLGELPGWSQTEKEISGGSFRVIAVRAEATDREVRSWTQPMIAPNERGLIAFLLRDIGGVPHVLVHADIEPGYMDVAELGPTVNQTGAEVGGPLADQVLNGRIRFDTVLSEEGGRFYHAENRYVVAEVSGDVAASEDYRWVAVADLAAMVQHGHLVNMQARTLLTCVRSLL
jgi:dTDP-4-dehydro-6-deoxy-alpha-D-glucopyranose 2,3-dehydratase